MKERVSIRALLIKLTSCQFGSSKPSACLEREKRTGKRNVVHEIDHRECSQNVINVRFRFGKRRFHYIARKLDPELLLLLF